MIGIDDPTSLRFLARRAGCGKHVVTEDAAFQLSIYRLEPGAQVPGHAHTRTHDIFVGVKGEVRIEIPGRGPGGAFVMGPGGVCTLAPGTPHAVVNAHATQDAFFTNERQSITFDGQQCCLRCSQLLDDSLLLDLKFVRARCSTECGNHAEH